VLRAFAGTLDPERGLVLQRGDPVEVDGVLCAIDGGVHECDALATALGLATPATPEAILATAYRRWGSRLAPRLRGEFTLLLWDGRERRGLLVQDQLGMRRLTVRRQGARLWFATELRDLLALLPTRPGPDPVAVGHWLTGRPAPGGATLYAGVECLGPGQLLELDRDGARPRRYWQPRFEEPLALGREELVGAVRAGLERAVARRATPGAPLGVLMSGGLDSTSVAVLAQRAGGEGAIGLSTVFPDHPGIDESPWIEALEAATGLPGVHLAARGQGIVASGLEYLDRWQLPLHAWNEAWTQPLMARAAELGVAAVLSGEGGDEVFGSRLYLTADLLRAGRPLAAARYARGLPEAGGRAPRRMLGRILWEFGLAGAPSASRVAAWRRLRGRGGEAPWWASPQMAARLGEIEDQSWRSLPGPRWWAALTHGLTEGAHGFGLYDHARRSAEAAGLEARHPLLDLDLFELMLRVPPLRCAEGRLTRPLLREAMAGLSPDPVRLRPDKSVFDDLVTGSLAGPELPALRLLLAEPREVGAYARPAAIAELLDRPPPGQRGDVGAWGDDLLRLAAIEAWLRSQSDPGLPGRLLDRPEVPPPSFRLESRGMKKGY
jgi:asparagine synthase (glutamine-hydrolysing)